MPYEFMVPILNTLPSVPRPLRPIMQSKVKQYLAVAEILVNRFPSDVGGRAVEFLLDLCQNRDPGPIVPLPWYERANPADAICVGLPRVVDRIIPAMTFEARFGR